MSAVDRPVSVLALDGSPTHGGRTRRALDGVAHGAASARATIETLNLDDSGEARDESVLRELELADAVILASPVYRASYAVPLKRLLDAIPRGHGDAPDSPLAGKAVAIVLTGASLHHYLALDQLRGVLAGFFAAHVVPPGLYVPRDGHASDGDGLIEPYRAQAHSHGEALVELARLLQTSTALRALRPQA